MRVYARSLAVKNTTSDIPLPSLALSARKEKQNQRDIGNRVNGLFPRNIVRALFKREKTGR